MTAEHIHDALTLLPADLIAEADKKRSQKPKLLWWKPLAAMAACFALVLGCALVCLPLFVGMGGSSTETAAAAPAAEAPMMQESSIETRAAAEAEPMETAPAAEEETLCGLPTAPVSENSTAANGGKASDEICIDHAHHPAEPFEEEVGGGWCGNMTATVYIGGDAYSLSGSDAVTLTDILFYLDYDPNALCRCMAEFTADTEMGSGYEISLTESFVRFEGGQAALTTEQADALREILAGLEN